MRERAVNQIDNNDSQQDDNSTGNIIDILLISGVIALPGVIDDSGNDVIHKIT